ncbi:hypothetical protein [Brevundimonas sp.]|uniref:hypothetical protein n=1 Tax=Brevundimonas sp. TaxID=1871086 RepID=UPI0035AD836A
MAFDANSTPAPVAHLALVAEQPALTRQRLRIRLCNLIDRLMTALDEIDGDPDFEDGSDDEPSLGFQEAREWDSQDIIIRCSPTGGVEWLDLEEACEDEGDEHDGREPETYN